MLQIGDSQSYLETVPPQDYKKIEKIWSKLHEDTQKEGPFLAPEWIKYWYNACYIKPTLITYYSNNILAGACFIGELKRKKFGINFRTALLNQSGDRESDQAWIEYNDLLCPDEHKGHFYRLLTEYLQQKGFDLFHLSMLHENAAKQYKHLLSVQRYDEVITKGYKTNLQNNANGFIFEKLSKNTRSQTRRSNRNLECAFGPLKVLLPKSTKEKSDFFDILATFHIQKWGTTPDGSGFNNLSFVKHQKKLLVGTDLSQIIGVFAGDTPLGFCINYLYENQVYFYCSGVNRTIATSHMKPGYSMHLALMEHYATMGFKTYDFLGGESRYKASLSDNEYTFSSLTIPLNTVKGKLFYMHKKLTR